MLVSKQTTVKWNARNKRHYTELGYEFTKMNESLLVNVADLTPGSQADVEVVCDYCGKIYITSWYVYSFCKKRSIVNKDSCKMCCEAKAEESIVLRYGSRSNHFAESNRKRSQTNLAKYGYENVFSSPEIKAKIANTNLATYGVPVSSLSTDVINKRKKTCLQKYGVEHYVELFKGKFIKDNSPCWKGGTEHSRVERATYEYQQWRKLVFSRDKFSCCACGAKSARDNPVELHAHHIMNWKDNPESRYDTVNGITLCEECHTAFHNKYGKRNTTREQIDEFLYKSDKKIC